METKSAIEKRRSIRNFKPDPIPDDILMDILTAGSKAPSGKNRQPWKFGILKGDAKNEAITIMGKTVGNLVNEGVDVGSSEETLRAMTEAAAIVFVFDWNGTHPWCDKTADQKDYELVDVQSIGAAIQNMLLAATELGVGSLWICDIFYAYEELCTYFKKDWLMVAAIAFGYTDAVPEPRPRKSIDEVVFMMD